MAKKDEASLPPETEAVYPATPLEAAQLHRSARQQKLMESIMRVQLAVGVIEKSAANPYFKSQYAPLDAIWAKATKACASEGIVVTQPATGHGVWTYVFHAPSGEWMACYMELPLVAPPAKGKDGTWVAGPVTPQVVGSITSYARRYSYLCALGLVAGEEDDDGNVSSGLEKKEATAKVAKRTLTERKEEAYRVITRFMGKKKPGQLVQEAELREFLGDILGRPMDDLVLKDEGELKLVEEYASTLTEQGE